MKKISLKNLSIAVIVAAITTTVVFANNDISNNIATNEEESKFVFSQLLVDYDVDNSKTLSAVELAKEDKLHNVFDKIDADNNDIIDGSEFNQYFVSIK